MKHFVSVNILDRFVCLTRFCGCWVVWIHFNGWSDVVCRVRRPLPLRKRSEGHVFLPSG